MTWQVINGNSAEILKTYPDNSFDCVVTDPPYGINFLGKSWDSNTGDREVYEQCLRVLKPGGHLLAFSAARTYHHLAMTVETVGFEIRDQIMWIYGSGFPKSQDIGRQIQKSLGIKEKKTIQGGARPSDKMNTPYADENEYETTVCTDPLAQQWSGWGTQLKPAHEPIVMARKPVIGSIRLNVLEHGTGAINIDATRVAGLTEKELNWTPQRQQAGDTTEIGTFGASGLVGKEISMFNDKGRFPANVIHDGSDEVVSLFPNSKDGVAGKRNKNGAMFDFGAHDNWGGYGGEGSAARFFYCPKVSGKERHIGHDKPPAMFGNVQGCYGPDGKRMAEGLDNRGGGNNHPTVKPIELMKYLIKLVTPMNGHILDPFNGSGSTGCAAVELGFDYTGIELDPNYVEIATKRISHWESECKPKTTYNNLFEEK